MSSGCWSMHSDVVTMSEEADVTSVDSQSVEQEPAEDEVIH